MRPALLAFFGGSLTLAAASALLDAQAQGISGAGSNLPNPLARLSLEELSATRDKPLFAPTRRPPAPPPPPPPAVVRQAPPPPPPQPPALTFFGVVSEADGARALVRGPSNESLRLRIGDEVEGWSVIEIDRRRLVLSLGERSETFSLFERRREGQARAPVPNFRRPQTAPNTGHLYEGRIPPRRPTRPVKDEPEL
jgi:hypothetical protein